MWLYLSRPARSSTHTTFNHHPRRSLATPCAAERRNEPKGKLRNKTISIARDSSSGRISKTSWTPCCWSIRMFEFVKIFSQFCLSLSARNSKSLRTIASSKSSTKGSGYNGIVRTSGGWSKIETIAKVIPKCWRIRSAKKNLWRNKSQTRSFLLALIPDHWLARRPLQRRSLQN